VPLGPLPFPMTAKGTTPMPIPAFSGRPSESVGSAFGQGSP
jgi:hypothetical protein